MMRWHKWFMAVSVSVCSVSHPEICIPRAFIFSSPYSSKTLSAFVAWFICVQISPGLRCVTFSLMISSMPLLNSYICKNEWWKTKVWVEKVLSYTGQCGNKDWCVGLLVSKNVLVSHSVQARPDKNPFVKTNSKCPFAAVNWQLWPHK